MAELREGQWELDGFVFGDGTPIWMVADGWDQGSPDNRTQDADRPHRDGTMFGRDTLGGPQWQFTWGVEHGRDTWPQLRAFQQTWRADARRYAPGELSVLRYRERGVTYRVYGRARKGDVVPAKRRNDQFQQVTTAFDLAGPEQCVEPDGGGPHRLTLRLIPVPTGGGLRLPARLPWRLAPGSQATSGTVEVGGIRPAAFTATVHGPISGRATGVRLSGPGWVLDSDVTLAYDQTLTVDTRTQSFTRDGVPVEGSLTYSSDLTARLEPGRHTFEFDSHDPTNTAYAVLSWYDTIPA